MPHQVQVLKNNTNLPNGFYYQNGDTVLLDDTEFARLARDAFSSGTLKDLGYVAVTGTATSSSGNAPGNAVYDNPSTGIYRGTIPRDQVTIDVAAALATGVMTVSAVWLNAGDTVNNIALPIGATVSGTLTHGWFALYNAAGTLLGQTADQTSGTYAASSLVDKALTTPAVISTSGPYYVGIMVASAGAMPSLICKVLPLATVSTGWDGQALLCGTTGSGLTTAAPSPWTAPTAAVNRILAYCH